MIYAIPEREGGRGMSGGEEEGKRGQEAGRGVGRVGLERIDGERGREI